MNSKKPKMFWVMGLLMIAAGLYLVISTITPPGYQTARGYISDERGFDREITFTAEDGKNYTAKDRSYSHNTQTSTEVMVAYSPDNPSQTMRVTSDSSRSTVWGAVVLTLGIGFMYLGLNKRQIRPPQETPIDSTPQKISKGKPSKKDRQS